MTNSEVKKFREFKWTPLRVVRLVLMSLFLVCGPAYLFCSLAAWTLNFALWHWSLRGMFGAFLFLGVPLFALVVAGWIEAKRKEALKAWRV
ncbi:hypothetical protein [uncultured Bilophila sp.]|uniref:hypothetical protein n=1 Tax=uncultured Bilophila sp. TaxID=529385 RepID=UPI0025E8153C|nr:hypothetical protein [uncultured Bilophila sp.]